MFCWGLRRWGAFFSGRFVDLVFACSARHPPSAPWGASMLVPRLSTITVTAAVALLCQRTCEPAGRHGHAAHDACGLDELVQGSPCQEEPSSAARLECAERAVEHADAQVAEQLARIRAAEPTALAKTYVEAEQEAWAHYRETSCDAWVGEHPGAGLGWAGSRALCVWARTEQRLLELRAR